MLKYTISYDYCDENGYEYLNNEETFYGDDFSLQVYIRQMYRHDCYNITAVESVEPVVSYMLLVDTDPYGQFEDINREVIFEVAEYPTREQAQAAADELNAKESLDKLGNPIREYFVRKKQSTKLN